MQLRVTYLNGMYGITGVSGKTSSRFPLIWLLGTENFKSGLPLGKRLQTELIVCHRVVKVFNCKHLILQLPRKKERKFSHAEHYSEVNREKPCGLNTQSGENLEPGKNTWGLGVCVVTLVARLPWLIHRASTPWGSASLPHSMGLCSSSIEKDSWFAEEKRVLSGAVMSSPQGSQWVVGAVHNRAGCLCPCCAGPFSDSQKAQILFPNCKWTWGGWGAEKKLGCVWKQGGDSWRFHLLVLSFSRHTHYIISAHHTSCKLTPVSICSLMANIQLSSQGLLNNTIYSSGPKIPWATSFTARVNHGVEADRGALI